MALDVPNDLDVFNRCRGEYIAVKAPASIANLGPGYDIVAMAINALHDYVEICSSPGTGNIEVVSQNYEVPSGLENSAYIVAKKFVELYGRSDIDLFIRVVKGIPPRAGLGSSGATAAGVSYGLAQLLKPDISEFELVKLAGYGEEFVSGSAHYDNVSASLFGGIVILDLSRGRAYRLIPRSPIYVAVVIPKTRQLSSEKTKFARSILPKAVDLHTHVLQSSAIAKLVYALSVGDVALFGEAVSTDYIVEPARSKLIPFYSELKRLALESGALGFNISGAGPSVFSVHSSNIEAEKVGKKLIEFLKHRGVESSLIVTKVSEKGVEVVERR